MSITERSGNNGCLGQMPHLKVVQELKSKSGDKSPLAIDRVYALESTKAQDDLKKALTRVLLLTEANMLLRGQCSGLELFTSVDVRNWVFAHVEDLTEQLDAQFRKTSALKLSQPFTFAPLAAATTAARDEQTVPRRAAADTSSSAPAPRRAAGGRKRRAVAAAAKEADAEQEQAEKSR